MDALFIVAEDAEIDSLLDADSADSTESKNIFTDNDYWELVTDPTTFGDAVIEISRLKAGIM